MTTKTHLVRTWGILALAGLFSTGCIVSSSSNASAPPPAEQAKKPANKKVAKNKKKADKKAAEPAGPALVHHLKDVGLEAPEAIIYDEKEDVYLVSNVNGDPLAKDGNGFISRVGPDGKIIELKWIDGQKKGITLNAPKGMAVSKGFVYVSDITWIRVFDRKTGEPKGKIFAKGATFLNDVTTDAQGEIVFSDTGWKSGKNGFAATGSDAVFRVDPKTVAAKEVAKGKQLGNPNGLAVTKEGVWVVNDQGELFLVGKDGKKEKTTKLAKGGLDGVVALKDGRFLVSSWKGKAIYHGKPGEKFEVLVGDLKSPASIGYDSKRDRVLVPKMKENQALIFDLSGKVPAKKAAPAEKASKKEAAQADGSKTAKKSDKASTTAKKGDKTTATAKKSDKASTATKKSDKSSTATKKSDKTTTTAKKSDSGGTTASQGSDTDTASKSSSTGTTTSKSDASEDDGATKKTETETKSKSDSSATKSEEKK